MQIIAVCCLLRFTAHQNREGHMPPEQANITNFKATPLVNIPHLLELRDA
jgi:hypothetical protein